MKFLVGVLVIGFLKENVCSDAGIRKLFVILDRCGGNVYVHAADRSVFVLYGIDGLDTLKNVFYGIVFRVLAGFYGKALVPHILEGNDLLSDLILRKLYARDRLVFSVVRTVSASVYTII